MSHAAASRSQSRTGVYSNTRGKRELAQRSTLFFDGVSGMSLRVQTGLGFLENGENGCGNEASQPSLDVSALARTNRQDGNESTRFTTGSVIRNVAVPAGDWPGPDVSTSHRQTSRREEGAAGANVAGLFAASGLIESSSPALRMRMPSWYGGCSFVGIAIRITDSTNIRQRVLARLPGLPRGRFRCNSTDPRGE
jgi:hypothetical protein